MVDASVFPVEFVEKVLEGSLEMRIGALNMSLGL